MANLWKSFYDLLPKQYSIIGVVTSIDNSLVTSVVELLSGETITVRGTRVPVGGTCLIQHGTITDQLPSMASYNAIIY